MQNTEDSINQESLQKLSGIGEGRCAFRSVPLSIGELAYWHAGARILKIGEEISEAVLLLKKTEGKVLRLVVIEEALRTGVLANADDVLDSVSNLIECDDDADGSASRKKFLAGWVCADVVGRCLNDAVSVEADREC